MAVQGRNIFTILIGLSLLLVAFNNCTGTSASRFSSLNEISSPVNITVGGGGDGYSGKIKFYDSYEPTNPCREVTTDDRPLPNSQLMLSTAGVQRIRVNCTDISPITLATNEYRIIDQNTIETMDAVFSHQVSQAFDTMVASCPVGYQTLANPNRVNLLAGGLDLTNQEHWWMEFVSADLVGSFAGMPSFLLTRKTDANADEWHRIGSSFNMVANEYSLSFFARSASANSVRVDIANTDHSIWARWDLSNGQLLDTFAVGNIAMIANTSTPIAGGYFITLSFAATTNLGNLQIGLAPGNYGLGSTIEATGVQFETIASFCGP